MPSLPPDSPDSPPTERCARYQVATHAGRTPSLPESGARSGPLERFGLFAGDAAGGELLGDGEHVEHEGQPTHAAGAENRLAAAQSIPRDFGAKARWRNGRFRPQTIGNIDRFRLSSYFGILRGQDTYFQLNKGNVRPIMPGSVNFPVWLRHDLPPMTLLCRVVHPLAGRHRHRDR